MITADGMVMSRVGHTAGRCRDRRLQAMKIETEREDDGRWIAEVPDLPGVIVYGESREEALSKVKALALRVLADRLEHGESIPDLGEVFSVPV
jgi:predicted RNase H-like HicB family nuclease